MVFVYIASNSLVNTLLLFSPAAFNAAVSVCFTTPTLLPLLTNLEIFGRHNTMPVSHWESIVESPVLGSCFLSAYPEPYKWSNSPMKSKWITGRATDHKIQRFEVQFFLEDSALFSWPYSHDKTNNNLLFSLIF